MSAGWGYRYPVCRLRNQLFRCHVSYASENEVATLARQVCAKLGGYGIDAAPLHVALGLEPNEKVNDDDNDKDDDDDHSEEAPLPFLVTFEGSARGLHFDAVDAVFVVGRPASASSYLHLAGRVGRAVAVAHGQIINCPGTVVSLCTKGQAVELEKWTRQLGGTGVEELQHCEYGIKKCINDGAKLKEWHY